MATALLLAVSSAAGMPVDGTRAIDAPAWVSGHDDDDDDGLHCGTHGDLDDEELAESEREFNAFRARKEQQSLADRKHQLPELNIDVIFYVRMGRVTPQRTFRGMPDRCVVYLTDLVFPKGKIYQSAA